MDHSQSPDPEAVPYGPEPTAKTEGDDLKPDGALLFVTGAAFVVFTVVV